MNSWRNIWTITKRELGAYFTSPLAYVFIVIFLLLCGFFTFFVGMFLERQRGVARPALLRLASVVLPVPCAGGGDALVGRRAARGHHRAAADDAHHGLAGHRWKVPGILAFPGSGAGADVSGGVTVNYLGHPDNGVILTAYVGSWLMAGAYLAISCITSALTRSQVVSFIISLVVCLFLILAGFPPVINVLEQFAAPRLVDMVTSFSVMTHFEGFQKGVLDSRDILFFLSVIGFSLFTTSVILRTHRAG